jgi:hypothetical protein
MCVHGCKSNKDAQQFVKRNATQKEKCNATSSGVAFFCACPQMYQIACAMPEKGADGDTIRAFFGSIRLR